MYRFLATPKWLGFAALMLGLAAIMVGLGHWQLDRYHTRHGVNERISHAAKTAPVPLSSLVTPVRPATGDQEWTRVSVTGTYDASKTVIARARTVDSSAGYEIITPLVLADGSAVMIDRGWLPTSGASETTPKSVPAPPSGPVTVSGRLHTPESSPDTPIRLDGALTVRRIAPARVAADLGYPVMYRDYVLLDSQTPAASGHLTRIPSDTQPAWMNAGYTVQWNAFALLALFGFGWAARREAILIRTGKADTAEDPANDTPDGTLPAAKPRKSRTALPKDRVEAADALARRP